VVVRDDLAAVFDHAGVRGTFVLHDAGGARTVVVDRARAQRPLVPASTYKIPHSLIALETGAVRDADELIPYGGKPQPIKDWERDMNLRDAVRVSNVPVFQQLAHRIGAAREQEWMRRLGYGNAEVGPVVDRFWLDGPLMISAEAQARWLCRLARQELPAAVVHQRTVRDILRLESTGSVALYGKTGWAAGTTQQVGWWVGWVERGTGVHCFALNIDIVADADADAAKRIPLGRELLHRLDVLPRP
jgi:beta-lactamase class D